MSAEERVRALVDKLLRMAAPTSGATPAEQASAALEACRLISKHGLLAARAAPGAPRPARTRAEAVNAWLERQRAAQITPFRRAAAVENSDCAEEGCRGPIYEGETVWRRIKNGQLEYVHEDCWVNSSAARDF